MRLKNQIFALFAMIANKIRVILKERKITVKALAQAIQMTESNLYRCFARDSIETKYLMRAAQFLEISPAYFLSDASSPKTNSSSVAGVSAPESLQYLQMLVDEKERLITQKDKYIDLLEKQLRISQATNSVPAAALEG